MNSQHQRSRYSDEKTLRASGRLVVVIGTVFSLCGIENPARSPFGAKRFEIGSMMKGFPGGIARGGAHNEEASIYLKKPHRASGHGHADRDGSAALRNVDA
jgi:hypothetical protein